jgi:hypothetical protein
LLCYGVTKSPGTFDLARQADKCISAIDTIIASNEDIAAKYRIDAEAASCEVALAITKLAFEGPIVLKDFAAYLR